MSDIPFYQAFRLKKPINTLYLPREITEEGEVSVRLKYEDGDIIKALKVESIFGNEVVLTETIDPETIEHRYMRECIGNRLDPLGKIIREDIVVEVFYKP